MAPEPAQIKAAEAGVKQAEAAVYLAQLQLDKTDVVAAADGFIYTLDAVEGGMAGQGTPLAVVFSAQPKIVIQVESSASGGGAGPAGRHTRGRVPVP